MKIRFSKQAEMSKVKVKPKFLRLTEATNALDFLEKAGCFIRETDESLIEWKWVVLSLHSALYGFAICACKSTSLENVIVRDKKGKKKLIPFDDALKACRNSHWMSRLYGGKVLTLSSCQQESIKRLQQELRNHFEHYTPKLWLIEVHGLPQMVLDILDIIRFLAVENNIYVNLNSSQIRKVKSVVYQGKLFIKKSKLYRETLIAET